MKLDRTLAREIRSLGGDGSRAAKFALLRRIDAVRADLSTPQVMTNFDDCVMKHGRAIVAVCVAATLNARHDFIGDWKIYWIDGVLNVLPSCITQQNLERAVIDDGLHFSRVCEYARSFILATSEEG